MAIENGIKNDKKKIPDSAIAREKAGIDPGSHELAENESKRINDYTYDKEIKDGRDKIQILNLNLYRWGITTVFFLSCLIVVFILALAALLLWNYAIFLVSDSKELGTFLSETWKVLTGASVVVFVQIIVWVVKSKMDEIRGISGRK